MAAGAAAAAIALEAALPTIAAVAGCPGTTRPRASAGPPAGIDLRSIFPGLATERLRLGSIAAVSGGAITNALLQTVLGLPQAEGQVRVIERERGDLTNLNRYSQLRASDEGELKIDVLAAASRGGVEVSGVEAFFNAETREQILSAYPRGHRRSRQRRSTLVGAAGRTISSGYRCNRQRVSGPDNAPYGRTLPRLRAP
jgi:hypothetical protein